MKMREFDAKVKKLVENMEDVAGMIIDNESIKEYFVEAYNYQEGVDNDMSVLMAYINDMYINVE